MNQEERGQLLINFTFEGDCMSNGGQPVYRPNREFKK